jgi:hypothetical protein
MEDNETHKQLLYKRPVKTNILLNVFQYFTLRELLDVRSTSNKIADVIVPELITHLPHDFRAEEVKEREFTRLVKKAEKVVINNIRGTEEDLKRIEQIGKSQGGDIDYLVLNFCKSDDIGSQESEEIARRYLEVFREYFKDIGVLRIQVTGDLNFSNMIALMVADPTFPWFASVHTIKLYLIRELKDKDLFNKFLTCFKGLKTLKGITEPEFNPLEDFIKPDFTS